MWNITENPWLFVSIGAFTLIIAGYYRMDQPLKSRTWHLLIPILIAASGLGIDYLFETDNEHIIRVVESCRKAVITENLDIISKYTSPDYRDDRHRSKEDFIADCDAIFTDLITEKIRRIKRHITIKGSSAVCDYNAAVHLNPKSRYTEGGNFLYIRVQISLQKSPDGNWLITHIKLVSVNNQPINWSDAL